MKDLKDLLTNTNFLGFLVVVCGIILSFKQPSAGHDVLIGGIGLIGGGQLASLQKKEKEQQ